MRAAWALGDMSLDSVNLKSLGLSSVSETYSLSNSCRMGAAPICSSGVSSSAVADAVVRGPETFDGSKAIEH